MVRWRPSAAPTTRASAATGEITSHAKKIESFDLDASAALLPQSDKSELLSPRIGHVTVHSMKRPCPLLGWERGRRSAVNPS